MATGAGDRNPVRKKNGNLCFLSKIYEEETKEDGKFTNVSLASDLLCFSAIK